MKYDDSDACGACLQYWEERERERDRVVDGSLVETVWRGTGKK